MVFVGEAQVFTKNHKMLSSHKKNWILKQIGKQNLEKRWL